MRLSQTATNLLTRLRAKPSKIALTTLLRQITQDRLVSILGEFWEDLYPKLKDRDISMSVRSCVSETINRLWTQAIQNGKRMTRSDYNAFIIDMQNTINGTFPDEVDKRRKAFCEQMIASLPWQALKLLWIGVRNINGKTTLRRLRGNIEIM